MTSADKRIRQIIEDYFGDDLDPNVYRSLKPHSLRGGEWLFHQGDPGDSLYFVVRGRLQAWTGNPDDGGPARLLGAVLPGDSVGEAGLLTGAVRTASIRAVRDSLLIRLDKAAFDALAVSHPAMVIRLASNVATMMQKNLAGSGESARAFSTITLLALHRTPRVKDALEHLCRALAEESGALVLDREGLGKLGAPQDSVSVADELPDALKQWAADQEHGHPLVVYRCDCEATPWTRFALRQGDIVVQLADAESHPAPSSSEQAILIDDDWAAGVQSLVLLHPAADTLEGTGAWLSPRRIDYHFHVREGRTEDAQRLLRILSGESVGLVLGAGGLRAFAALGVCKALHEARVPIDWIGGSSMGGVAGALLASGVSPQEAIDQVRVAIRAPGAGGGETSMNYSEQVGQLLNAIPDSSIEDLPLPFFCISSNLERGELHVHETGSLRQALQAGTALPGILPPVDWFGQTLVDGAVLSHLPVDVMSRLPVGRIVAVDVASRTQEVASEEEALSRQGAEGSRWWPFARRQPSSGLANMILRSAEIGMLSSVSEHGRLADVLVRPQVQDFGVTDVNAIDSIIEAGYREALACLDSSSV